MEISQIETNLTDTRVELIEHQETTQEFKNNVQEIFIDVFNQEEFSQKVDAIFNEIFKGDRRWSAPFLRSPKKTPFYGVRKLTLI